jgi:streptogramin lyase
LDPASGAYTLYTGFINPSDGQLGPDGKLWYSLDDNQLIGRMDLASRVVTTWTMPTGSANRLAFDDFGRVWSLDEFDKVDRFNPNTHEMCSMALPGAVAGGGEYVVAGGGAIWLGDGNNGAIGRITATLSVSPTYTYWSLPTDLGTPLPVGLALAPNGEVWWADQGVRMVGRLTPNTNRVTFFGPPNQVAPEQVAYHAGRVWFTDPFTSTLGVLDPATAVGVGPFVVTPTVATLAPACVVVADGPTFTAGMSTGQAAFTPVVFTPTVDAEGTLYTAPPNGQPFGLAFLGFDLWVTDKGRDTLIRIDTAAAHLYLPLVRR